MPSSLNTDALRTLLESDFLSLDELLDSLDLSQDNLLTALSGGLLSNSAIADDSLAGILQTFYKAASKTASETDRSDGSFDSAASQKIQTLLDAVNSQPDSFENLAIALNSAFNSSSAAKTVFAFANSIFTNNGDGNSDRTQSLLDKATKAYQSFIPPDAAAFTTIARNGQRINNGQSSAEPLKWTNTSNGKTNVTFAFDDVFAVNGLSFDRAKELFVSALSTWSQYAPLNFQEIEDPGSTSQVDILVQSDFIDNAGGTLAFAYFPTFGDITFDNSESWSETKFLETATHELGHSLGLDHEGDVSAIMNPVLDNKFAGGNGPFLLQDDINGIRNLYGSGNGNVSTLGQGVVQPQEPVAAPPVNNLVSNGSFEDTPVQENSTRVYSRVKGWTIFSGTGFRVDRRTQESGNAADGTAWVELDVYGKNSTIYQNVDTVTGQNYTLSVDFTSGGRDPNTTAVDVFWEGQKIDTLTGGGRGSWTNYQYNVEGANRNVSTLAFRAVGAVDSIGGFIDNVSVFAGANATALTDSAQHSHCQCSHCQGHGHRHNHGMATISHNHGHSHNHSHAMGSALQQSGQISLNRSTDFVADLIMGEQPNISPDTAVLA